MPDQPNLVVVEVTIAPTTRALAAVIGVLRLRANDVDHLTWSTRQNGPAILQISMAAARPAHVFAALRRLVEVTEVHVVATDVAAAGHKVSGA